jgi:hypothetical protein
VVSRAESHPRIGPPRRAQLENSDRERGGRQSCGCFCCHSDGRITQEASQSARCPRVPRTQISLRNASAAPERARLSARRVLGARLRCAHTRYERMVRTERTRRSRVPVVTRFLPPLLSIAHRPSCRRCYVRRPDDRRGCPKSSPRKPKPRQLAPEHRRFQIAAATCRQIDATRHRFHLSGVRGNHRQRRQRYVEDFIVRREVISRCASVQTALGSKLPRIIGWSLPTTDNTRSTEYLSRS